MVEKLKIEYIEIEKLTHYAKNSKIHTNEQVGHISNSIKKFGFNDPLGIAGEDNVVLEGNGRVDAARLLGYKTLPCIRLDHLSKEEQKAYVIAHNATNLETGFDDQILLEELQSLDNYNFQDFGVDISSMYNDINNDLYYTQLLANHMKKLVRNEFVCVGKYDLPLVRKQEIDSEKIKLRSFSNTKFHDTKNKNKTIHFFIHDYKFEYTYSNPEIALEKVKQYDYLLTPDFSLYTDMPLLLQMYNTFKNRWVGAYWQSQGLKVIPTISWSDERSFNFCFDGVEEGSIIAVSTHGNHKAKEEFLLGYNKMLEKIKPSVILCYGKPFPEMRGNILVFPYNRHEHSEGNV